LIRTVKRNGSHRLPINYESKVTAPLKTSDIFGDDIGPPTPSYFKNKMSEMKLTSKRLSDEKYKI
jgi:hypothetical protein